MKNKIFLNLVPPTFAGFDRGLYNGYVAVYKDHPLFGKEYDDRIELPEATRKKIKFNGNWLGLIAESGKEDEKISLDMVVEVHGGITYADSGESFTNLSGTPEGRGLNKLNEDWWIFGFDTAHAGDTMGEWTREKTLKEARKLSRELNKVKTWLS